MRTGGLAGSVLLGWLAGAVWRDSVFICSVLANVCGLVQCGSLEFRTVVSGFGPGCLIPVFGCERKTEVQIGSSAEAAARPPLPKNLKIAVGRDEAGWAAS